MDQIDIISSNKEDFEHLNNANFTGLSGFFGKRSFLQSFFWGKIQELYKRKCLYFIFKSKNDFLGSSLIIENSFLFNKFKYWYIPRGPVFKENVSFEVKNNIFSGLRRLAGKNKIAFIRFEPFDLFLSDKNFIKKTTDIQPAKTSFLDLNKSYEDILSEMKQKTRYNIRLAQKKGIEVYEAKDKEVAFLNFINLIKQTSLRDDFSIHRDDYYKNLIDFNQGFIRVFEARYQNQIVASGIFSFYGNCVSYLHGASADSFRNVMAPYLLHSEMINLAKKENFSFYDFYGVDESKWPGVSRFKKGFGGEEFSYPGTYDLLVNKFVYFVYLCFRFLKKTFF